MERIAPEEFERQGFTLRRRAVGEALLVRIEALTERWERERAGPLELESEVGYPGAPARDASEQSVRRFLQVFQRDAIFSELLVTSGIARDVRALLGGAPRLVLAHHNCLMTKQPRLSSDTPWHRDRRYWSFERGELVTTWIALGEESLPRGGLKLVPGSHRVDLPATCFDEREALIPNLAETHELVGSAVAPALGRGDVLFFHCGLLHCASRNHEATPKRSLVFTFRREDDRPLPGTRSAAGDEVALD